MPVKGIQALKNPNQFIVTGTEHPCLCFIGWRDVTRDETAEKPGKDLIRRCSHMPLKECRFYSEYRIVSSLKHYIIRFIFLAAVESEFQGGSVGGRNSEAVVVIWTAFKDA